MYYFLYLYVVVGALLIKGYSCTSFPPKQVEAFADGNVILPCSLKVRASDNIPTVEWSKVIEGQKPSVVFLYRDGCETFEMKDPDFEHRTNLIMREVKNGNVSLRISNVKPSDNGMYQCLIIQNNGFREETKVRLVVAVLEESTTTTTIWIYVTLAVSVLFNLLSMLYLLLRKKQSKTDGGKSITAEEQVRPTHDNSGESSSLLYQRSLTHNIQNTIIEELNKQRHNADTIQIQDPSFWKKPFCQMNQPATTQCPTSCSPDSSEALHQFFDPNTEAANSPEDHEAKYACSEAEKSVRSEKNSPECGS